MNKIFFITAPNSPTGGPTLLHQAAKELRLMGYDAFILYDGAKKLLDPVHEKFKEYNIPFVTSIDSIKGLDIIIVPEQFNLIKKYSSLKNKKIIWWLSVDNYVVSKFYNSLIGKFTKALLKLLNGSNYKYVEHFEIANKITSKKSLYINKYDQHWVQSNYALEFLKNFKFFPKFVGDYLVEEFDNVTNENKKQNIVCYSPSKGFNITKKIIKYNPHINFVPIQNMTPEEVQSLLNKSKIYIDFGNHPGQDRIPREAMISGCVVIVGQRGSAINDIDVPIASTYKFPKKLEDKHYKKLRVLFEEIFINYNNNLENQKEYLKMIKLQKSKFIIDLKKAIEGI